MTRKYIWGYAKEKLDDAQRLAILTDPDTVSHLHIIAHIYVIIPLGYSSLSRIPVRGFTIFFGRLIRFEDNNVKLKCDIF